MTNIIDIHIHLAGTGDEGTGCIMSKKFKSSFFYYALLLLAKTKQLNDKVARDTILDVIKTSKNISRVVLLALDCVVEKNGDERPDISGIVTPNEYVIKICSENKDRALFGASIHPYRKDSLDLIDRCVEEGAVLMKWIPSSQGIDPQNRKCFKFYDKLAKIGLPLLCHTGPETVIPKAPNAIEDYNSPIRLIPALEKGVKVVAAHCATSAFLENQKYFDEFLYMINLAEKERLQLYGDVSAFSNPAKRRFIFKIKENVDQKRLLFGTDYPVPVFDMRAQAALKRVVSKWFGILGNTNPLDKNYDILKNQWGFDDVVFTNAHNVLLMNSKDEKRITVKEMIKTNRT